MWVILSWRLRLGVLGVRDALVGRFDVILVLGIGVGGGIYSIGWECLLEFGILWK